MRASEGQHWYRQDGTPAYTHINKKGEIKPNTLRDAKKEGLVPSVTMLINEISKPALLAWKEQQTIMACLTLPIIAGESEESYIDRLKADSREHARKAAERGTQIHAYVQRGFEGRSYESEKERDFYLSAKNCINSHGMEYEDWLCEKSFALDGYGGKCDLHTQNYVIDIKTKDCADINTAIIYDEHTMQLSAYRYGLQVHNAKCGILFISTQSKECKILWIKEEDLMRGFKMFTAIKKYYYAKTGL